MLTFGTSGLRGLVSDMTDRECYINARGFLEFLLAQGDIHPQATVVMAGDLRSSTERILRAVAQGIADSGCCLEYAGKIPTPALVYYALSRQQASIMVTGSHIPEDRNGIKFHTPQGEVLKRDEPRILQSIASLRSRLASARESQSRLTSPALPKAVCAPLEFYRQRYLDVFPADCLAGQTVVVDQHTAVGRDLLPELLTALGARVIACGRCETFVARDTENITPELRNEFRALAKKHNPAAIVSLDGDSDRPLIADETGSVCPGDLLGAWVAKELQASYAAVPISANDALDAFCSNQGIRVQRTKIGSPFVIAAMEEACRQGQTRVVGWEANGGFILGSDSVYGQGCLVSLPTRDAMLPILVMLWSGKKQGSIKRLAESFPQRFTWSGLLDSFPASSAHAMLSALQPAGDMMEVNFLPEKTTVQYHNNQIKTLTASNGDILDKLLNIKSHLEKECFLAVQGYAPVCQINYLDGVRIRFNNDDVVHIRPSGNAPQLRIYTQANTLERAGAIAHHCIEENGVLRRMAFKIQ